MRGEALETNLEALETLFGSFLLAVDCFLYT